MKTRATLPCSVREVENLWIPLSDGVRLAARAWLPETAAREPVPAILEYLPYRKRDGTRKRDEHVHRYFAGHGYASLRVDLRGSGDSEGLLLDEYLEREQLDGVEVIAWIARQPWCAGAVGMMGKSWGGFNALQVAALRPPALRAVIAVACSDDRYADDAHYMGGCLLNENLTWGSVLFTLNAFPPDPQIVGERWRPMWLERLRATPLFPALWLAHQRRDAYWQHGSVCEAFDRIACPVWAVGGWADGYSNAVPRLLAGLGERCRGLVGPWAHTYPHEGVPGPAIGFLQEALRFWDRWLRGVGEGFERDPPYRVWLQASAAPDPSRAVRPGRWVAEDAWPSPRTEWRAYGLAPGRLVEPPAATDAVLEHRSSQTHGLCAGAWCGFGLEGDLPGDQRADDELALVLDSEPLAQDLEMLGAARLRARVTVDRPVAFLVARLCDVAPDGASERVSYGLANLTHRRDHAHPEALEPGRPYEIELQLNHAAHSFPRGHRLRLALATSYWPVVWPSPEPVALRLLAGSSRFELPARPARPEDARLRPFGPPEAAPASEVVALETAGVQRGLERDPRTGEVVVSVVMDESHDGGPALERLGAIDLVYGHSLRETFKIRPDDPLSARAEVEQRAQFARGAWSTHVETRVRLSASPREFRVEAELEAREGDRTVVSRRFDTRVPRDHV